MADKKSRGNFLIWWRIDPDKLSEQVDQYNSLKIYQSARGISFLWFVLSIIVTVIMIFTNVATKNALVDIILFLMLGIFMYKGHRWAMIAAMILWTIEKLMALVAAPVYFIVQFVWWGMYMRSFYFAYMIEKQRNSLIQNEDKE